MRITLICQVLLRERSCHASFWRSTSELSKRHAEDFLASDNAKIAFVAPSPGQSVMGAYPAAQNQWAASYGLQSQAWPQIAQAQGQQWNTRYSQQIATRVTTARYGVKLSPSFFMPSNWTGCLGVMNVIAAK